MEKQTAKVLRDFFALPDREREEIYILLKEYMQATNHLQQRMLYENIQSRLSLYNLGPVDSNICKVCGK